ncbi:GntR family transcriptional regulator [Aureimonas altamirensis]|uniref:GntR family transcriptional regulator n=1 Tax=Aureimonas altamirensis TaxID=370622 RepID=UPI001E63A877|nr:GntR family transcriptional regulator [Aureimonas altamirensis]UHD46443.1 GntR family transcriptional regulator [Aureimonas altamirensis]
MAGTASERGTGLLKRPPRLVDDVYEAIYAQLMSLKIPPGGRLSIDSLVRELGVSQTPIREALSRLEALGLVEKIQHVGYSAAGQIDRQRFEQLYELRLLLEPFAAGRAALRITKRVVETLERQHRTMQAGRGRTSTLAYAEFARQDAEFHDLIAQAGGNEPVRDALSRLHTHIHLFRLHYHSRATAEANEEHERIIAALKIRDAAAADAAMREHIERSRDRFLSAFEDD